MLINSDCCPTLPEGLASSASEYSRLSSMLAEKRRSEAGGGVWRRSKSKSAALNSIEYIMKNKSVTLISY